MHAQKLTSCQLSPSQSLSDVKDEKKQQILCCNITSAYPTHCCNRSKQILQQFADRQQLHTTNRQHPEPSFNHSTLHLLKLKYIQR